MGFLSSPPANRRDLSIILARHYTLGRLLSFKKLKKGFANSLYRLQTTTGDFVLKVAVRNNPVRIRYEIDLLNHLSGLPVPKPIATRSGAYLFDYKGHQSFMYPFLPGRETYRFTRAMLAQVGGFLGKLHWQTKNFRSPVKRMELYRIPARKLGKIIEISGRLRDRKIRDALDYLEAQTLRYKLPHALLHGAMHIDLKAENTLFDEKRLTGVVDFDNSYIGPLVLDLANTIMWFCSKKGRFDTAKAKIIYKGYVRTRKLKADEDWALFDALHYAFLSHVLIDIYFLALGKLPKSYILWGIANLLETEKNIRFTRAEFRKMLS